MRRLVLLLSAIVALDIMFFAALAPLLPHFVSEFGLSEGRGGAALRLIRRRVLALRFRAVSQRRVSGRARRRSAEWR